MIGVVKQWSSLICIASLICVIAELILPPGKIEKTIQMVLGLFMICVVISPISGSLKRSIPELKLKKENIEIKKKNGFMDNINSQVQDFASDNVRAVIKGTLKDIGINPEKIEIFMDTNEDSCISIIRCKIYLFREYEKQREKVIDTLKNKLGIETEVIIN